MAKATAEGFTSGRLLRWLLALPIAFVLVSSGSDRLFGPGAALAQERPRTIMDMLFGEPPRRERQLQQKVKPRRVLRQKSKASRKKPARRSSASTNARASVARPAVPKVVAKSEAARTVLVVGDFMAESLASGLQDSFGKNADIKVSVAAEGSSGLVRSEHYSWIDRIGPLIDERKPAVVVVMLGSNDRQPLALPDGAAELRSDAWITEYERRASDFSKIVKAKNVPLVWVGMPSFKFDRMSEDMAFFNEVYRKAAAEVGGQFVDVWDGFVDASGAFTYSGPDTAGQQARLRNSDGLTMTPEGEEKLAFFAQRPILRLLGTGSEPGFMNMTPEDLAKMQAVPAAPLANATSTPAFALTDPALDGGDVLLGVGFSASRTLEPSPRDRLVVTGTPAASPEGRADNFSWNAKTSAVSTVRESTPAISRGTVDLKELRASEGPVPPREMPSLEEAIVEDWALQPVPSAGSAKAVPAPAPHPQPPTSPPAAAVSAVAPRAAPQPRMPLPASVEKTPAAAPRPRAAPPAPVVKAAPDIASSRPARTPARAAVRAPASAPRSPARPKPAKAQPDAAPQRPVSASPFARDQSPR